MYRLPVPTGGGVEDAALAGKVATNEPPIATQAAAIGTKRRQPSDWREKCTTMSVFTFLGLSDPSLTQIGRTTPKSRHT